MLPKGIELVLNDTTPEEVPVPVKITAMRLNIQINHKLNTALPAGS